MQATTVGNLVKNQSINNITPVLFNKDYVKPIVLFTILSLNANRNAFKLMNLNEITRYPDLLSSRIKSGILDITKINEIINSITYDEINDVMKLKFSNFEKYGNQFIQPQILLSEFYKYLGLNYLIIESFENRTKHLIGFSNYLKFNTKLELITNKAERTLLTEKYKNLNITKLETYPDFLIVNEWENNYYIDGQLYDYPDKCDILDGGVTMDKFIYTLFGKQQYRLISCIATNYVDPPEILDDRFVPYKVDFDNLNKHTIIYLVDENGAVYVHTNREFSFNTPTKGFIYTGNKKTELVCNKIYQLPRDDTYTYEFAFNKEKCELKKGVYDNTTFNFSMKRGNRTFIYYKQKEIIQQPPKAQQPQPQQPPPPQQPQKQKDPTKVRKPDSISSLSGVVSIDNDLKKHLKSINFKEYLNDFKARINKFYSKSSANLASKIIDDNNDDILKENNDMLKDKIRGKVGSKDMRLLSLDKISSNDKKVIIEKIEKDMKKQRKALEMKLHIFLTMSFQILISKITTKAEKELNKYYKNDYKEKIKLIKKTKQAKKSSSASIKSATPKPQSPKPSKPQTPKSPKPQKQPTPPPQPGPPPQPQPGQGKKNKKKKK